MAANIEDKVIEKLRVLPESQQAEDLKFVEALADVEAKADNGPAVGRAQPTHSDNGDDETRGRRLEWLKSHREEYGGQYVALDGDRLIAVGPNYRVAREKARAAGKSDAFVTYLSKPDELAEMGVGCELPTFFGVGGIDAFRKGREVFVSIQATADF